MLYNPVIPIMSEKIHIRNESSELQRYREEVDEVVKKFMQDNGIEAVIGLSGDASSSSEDEVTKIVKDLIANMKGLPYAILTGGTQGGVPQLGIQIAKEAKVPTIGVYPEQGRKKSLGDALDLEIEASPPMYGPGKYGSETPTFVNLLGGAAVIGGGFGTLTEVSTLLKINKMRLDGNETPIFLSPISGTGGVADAIHTLPGIDKVAPSLPIEPITTGADAALFLKNKLDLSPTE